MALKGRKISLMDYSVENNAEYECGVTEYITKLTYLGFTADEARAKAVLKLDSVKQRIIDLTGATEAEASASVQALIDEDKELFDAIVAEEQAAMLEGSE